MKKLINLFILFMMIFITGCSNSGDCAVNKSAPIQIGTLPNGSTVYLSQNNLPLSDGTSAQATIYLEGGRPNESYNITFATNRLPKTKLTSNKLHTDSNLRDCSLPPQNALAVSEDYGINIATNPTPCVIGTVGSGAASQCKLTITTSANTYPGTYTITPSATPLTSQGSATILSPLTILVSGSIKPSSKSITSFALNGTNGVISGQNITVTMPYGTDVTALVATYITTGQSVKVNDITQVNGVTENNFTNPVVYTVTAEDGSTQNYTVTVNVAQNNAKSITAFSLDGTAGTISGQGITVTMPYGTNVTALIATYTTTGQSVKVSNVTQISGITANDFTSPVIYTVTAADGTTQDYTVTVTVATGSANEMIEFSLNGTIGVIDQNNNTITVQMPYGSDLTDLTATYLTDGESVAVCGSPQVNGVTSHNFTNPVTYTVYAANGDAHDYVVTATVKPVISQATAISFLGNHAYLTSNISSDITRCNVINESELTNCVNIDLGNNLLPNGASNISAIESTGGETLFITGNDNPPSIIQCLLPKGNAVLTGNALPCAKINPAVGLQSSQLLSTTVPNPESSAKITSFAVAGVSGLINNDNDSIYVALPYGANLNGLVATFTATGKSVKVNNVLQVSGVTSNNYVNNTATQYVVTAKNNTTHTYNVYVYWTTFSGMTLNTYASSIRIPVVYSGFTNRMMNMSLIESNGMYVGLNYDYINSFPAEMNATGLSSISLATYENSGILESYNYIMTNIVESQIYACSVNESATEMNGCSAATYSQGAIPQPSSAVIYLQAVKSSPYVTLPGYIMVASYSQNTLTGCTFNPHTISIACDTDPANQANMSGVFNLPHSLSLNSTKTWLFALNDGDNSYAACPIINSGINPADCRKIYFSSL